MNSEGSVPFGKIRLIFALRTREILHLIVIVKLDEKAGDRRKNCLEKLVDILVSIYLIIFKNRVEK